MYKFNISDDAIDYILEIEDGVDINIGHFEAEWHKQYFGVYQSADCATCSNNPKNNPYASGICHCILGSPKIT